MSPSSYIVFMGNAVILFLWVTRFMARSSLMVGAWIGSRTSTKISDYMPWIGSKALTKVSDYMPPNISQASAVPSTSSKWEMNMIVYYWLVGSALKPTLQGPATNHRLELLSSR